MILNRNTDMYLRSPRPVTSRRKSIPVAIEGERIPAGRLRPDPHGSLEEKCTWMRQRQQQRRKTKSRKGEWRVVA